MYRAVYRGVKKLRKVFSLKADNKAETGIGTLIIFIAMVLVAAVAATVLINYINITFLYNSLLILL